MRSFGWQRGFTLVELIMVIVIIGIIGGMVSVFMKSPIDAYFASGRRAALTDTADTTVRRMARDIQRALPNSIRTPSNQCVEFIPTKTGGRYRVDDTPAGLNFAATDGSFTMLASNTTFAGRPLPPDQKIVAGDVIVVYNLGIAGVDAYAANPNNTSLVSATAPVPLAESGAPVETTIPIDDKLFPLASSSNRFHVVSGTEQVVRYACVGASGVDAQGRGLGTLFRQVLSLPLASAACPGSALTAPVIANNVSACNFDYTGSDLMRNALIRMTLQLTDSNETVSLQHEVHVSNTP